MIACYAWSNLQLVNLTNTKLNLYKNEPADLFIRIPNFNQISLQLVNTIKESGVFANIYYVEIPHVVKKERFFRYIPRVIDITQRKQYIDFYRTSYNSMVGRKEYNRILVPMFLGSADVLFFIHHWYNENRKKLKISFVDEGCGSYLLTPKELFYVDHKLLTIKERLRFRFNYRSLSQKYKRAVDTFCTYSPAHATKLKGAIPMQIPQIDNETNPIMFELIKNATSKIDSTHVNAYYKKSVYFFSTYPRNRQPYFDKRTEEIINTIISAVGVNEFVIKVHINSKRHAENYAKSYSSKIYVDRENYFFEGLLPYIDNVEDKIFISYMSTTAMNPKMMLNKEPYIIITNKLYKDVKDADLHRESMHENIVLSLYGNKSKVMIPHSLIEFKEMLNDILTALYSKKFNSNC